MVCLIFLINTSSEIADTMRCILNPEYFSEAVLNAATSATVVVSARGSGFEGGTVESSIM